MNYIHHIPGRMRIRCAALKGNAVRAVSAKAMLASQPGVESVDVNAVTGSVLIAYSTQADAARLLALLREHGYTRSSHPVTASSLETRSSTAPHSNTAEIGSVLAKTVVSFAIEKAVERSVLALAAALL